ncbi:MAG: Ig-like domain-containing protein, partial [Terriglobales bacterium]
MKVDISRNLWILLALLVMITSCGTGTREFREAVVAASISPVSAALLTGATQQFTANITGSSNTAVTWSATGGTVSSNGLYTAPATAGTYSVTATSQADTTKSASATVTVTTPPVVAVSVSPVSAALLTGATQQFAATVTG